MKTRKALLLLAAITAASTVYADKVQFSQLPQAVQNTIRTRSGRHQIEDVDRDVKNGQTTYEASWKDQAGAQQELLISDSGKIIRDVPHAKNKTAGPVVGVPNPVGTIPAQTSSSRVATNATVAAFSNGQTAPMNWASETLQNKLKTLSNGATISNFQKGQFNGKTAYRASYKQNNRNVTVVLGEDGTVLAANPANAVTLGSTSTTSAPTLLNAQSAPLNWASESVQKKFKQMANGAPIENFQKGQFNGRTAFQGTYFRPDGQAVTVVIGEDGTMFAGGPGTSVSGSASGQ